MRDVEDRELLAAADSFFRSLETVRRIDSLRPAADAGDTAVMREIADLYEKAGRPVEAAEWLAKASGDTEKANWWGRIADGRVAHSPRRRKLFWSKTG